VAWRWRHGRTVEGPWASVLSRMFDVFGHTIDQGEALSEVQWRPYTRPAATGQRSTKSEIFETGIKVIDCSCHWSAAARRDCSAGGRGQDRPPHRDDPQHDRAPAGHQHFLRHRRTLSRRRELYRDMKDAGVLPNMVMVFGQMNEPPGSRFRVGFAALTMAEYFRTMNTRCAAVIDNIFRFIQAGMEVSGLMGRCRPLGVSAHDGTELSGLEERIANTIAAHHFNSGGVCAGG